MPSDRREGLKYARAEEAQRDHDRRQRQEARRDAPERIALDRGGLECDQEEGKDGSGLGEERAGHRQRRQGNETPTGARAE